MRGRADLLPLFADSEGAGANPPRRNCLYVALLCAISCPCMTNVRLFLYPQWQTDDFLSIYTIISVSVTSVSLPAPFSGRYGPAVPARRQRRLSSLPALRP